MKRSWTALTLTLALPTALSIGWAGSNALHASEGTVEATGLSALPRATAPLPARPWEQAFEAIAEHASPSVVSIDAAKRVQVSAPQLPPGFERFFNLPQQQMPREQFQQGAGTGFVVREDGYIVTNHHVVGDAEHVQVTLQDGQVFEAEVVGSDERTDVAVVRIDADGLPALSLGDSEELRPGQWIAAVGNPFGLSTTITSGIISAKGRTRLGLVDYEDFIQTDAAINPGNSGGPMLDLDGRVIGINTAIFSRSGGSMGIGFAIPINLARGIIDDLITDGRVQRGWLGVSIQDVDRDLARSFGWEGEGGALVNQVVEGSPAEGHLEVGDIIVRVGEHAIASVNELRIRVASFDPGSEVEIAFVRDGSEKTATVELGTLEEADIVAERTTPTNELGLELESLSPNARQQLGLGDDVEGVLVTAVEPFSAASRANLTVGDVVVSVEGEPVTTPRELELALRAHDLEAGVRLVVERAQGRRFVVLKASGLER